MAVCVCVCFMMSGFASCDDVCVCELRLRVCKHACVQGYVSVCGHGPSFGRTTINDADEPRFASVCMPPTHHQPRVQLTQQVDGACSTAPCRSSARALASVGGDQWIMCPLSAQNVAGLQRNIPQDSTMSCKAIGSVQPARSIGDTRLGRSATRKATQNKKQVCASERVLRVRPILSSRMLVEMCPSPVACQSACSHAMDLRTFRSVRAGSEAFSTLPKRQERVELLAQPNTVLLFRRPAWRRRCGVKGALLASPAKGSN